MSNRDRYKEFEQMMTVSLIANVLVFIAYLIAAAAHIGWLRIVFAVLTLGSSLLGLGMLYLNRELTKPRSLWMGCGYFGVLCCTLASLILAYPG